MVLWAQGKSETYPDTLGHGSTTSGSTPLGNLRQSGIGDGDWLDRWYPPQVALNIKPLETRVDCVAEKSRWGPAKRPEKLGKCQTKLRHSLPGTPKSSCSEGISDQRVYSITSDHHFYSDTYLPTEHTRSTEEGVKNLSILNKIAKHILTLDTKRNERKRPLKSNVFEPTQEKPTVARDPTLPSPRNVEGALASPFYDPDFWVPRRPLAPNRVYHFHVIYNHAQCSLGRSYDTDLALRVTSSLVEKLELRGYVNGYYHDRDRRSHHSLAAEMERVITGSSLTILLLTPGFVRDCLDRYLQIEAFRKLLTDQNSSNNQLVIMGVGVTEASLPLILGRHEVLFFKENDWETDHPAWAKLDSVLLGNFRKKHRVDSPRRLASTVETQQRVKDFHKNGFHEVYDRFSGLDCGISHNQSAEIPLNIPEYTCKQEKAAEPRQILQHDGNRKEGKQTELRKQYISVPLHQDLTKNSVLRQPKATKGAVSTGEEMVETCKRGDKYTIQFHSSALKPHLIQDHKAPLHSGKMETTSPSGKYFRLTEHLLLTDDLHDMGHGHVAWDPGGKWSSTARMPLFHQSNRLVGNASQDLRFGSENGDEYEHNSDDGSDVTLLDNSFDSTRTEKHDRDFNHHRLETFREPSVYKQHLDDTLENIYFPRQFQQPGPEEHIEFENSENSMFEDNFLDNTNDSVHTLDSLELDDMRKRYGFEKFRYDEFEYESLNDTFDSEHTLNSEELHDMRRRYGFEDTEIITPRTESSVCSLDTVELEEVRERYGFEKNDLIDVQNACNKIDLFDNTDLKPLQFLETPSDYIIEDETYNDTSGKRVISRSLTRNKDDHSNNFHPGMEILMQEMHVVNGLAPEDTRYDTRYQWQSRPFRAKKEHFELSTRGQQLQDRVLQIEQNKHPEINPFVSTTPTIEELWAKWVDPPPTVTDAFKLDVCIEQTPFEFANSHEKSNAKNYIDSFCVSDVKRTNQESQQVPSLCSIAYKAVPNQCENILSSGVTQQWPSQIEACTVNTISKQAGELHLQETTAPNSIDNQIDFPSDLSKTPNVHDENDLGCIKLNSIPSDLAISPGEYEPINDRGGGGTPKDQEKIAHSNQVTYLKMCEESTISSALVTGPLSDQGNTSHTNYQKVAIDPKCRASRDEDNQKWSLSFNQKCAVLIDEVDVALSKREKVVSCNPDAVNLQDREDNFINTDQLNETLEQEILTTQGSEQLNAVNIEVQFKEHQDTSCDLAEELDLSTNHTQTCKSITDALVVTCETLTEETVRNDKAFKDLLKEPRVEKNNKLNTEGKEMQHTVKTDSHGLECLTASQSCGNPLGKVTKTKITEQEQNCVYQDFTSISLEVCDKSNVASEHKEYIEEMKNTKGGISQDRTSDDNHTDVFLVNELHSSLSKVFYAEDEIEKNIIAQILAENMNSREHKHQNESYKQQDFEESNYITEEIETEHQKVQACKAIPESKNSHPSPTDITSHEDGKSPQLNVAALNVAHEILTHMLMAKTTPKNKDEVAPREQIGSVIAKTSMSPLGCDKRHLEINLETQKSVTTDFVDSDRLPKTDSSTVELHVEEQHRISRFNLGRVSDDYGDRGRKLSIDEEKKDLCLSSWSKDEESTVCICDIGSSKGNLYEHTSSIEGACTASFSSESLVALEQQENQSSQSQAKEAYIHSELLHEEDKILDFYNSTRTPGHGDKQKEIPKYETKKCGQKIDIKACTGTETSSLDDQFETLNKSDLCGGTVLKSEKEIFSFYPAELRQDFSSNEIINPPLVYNMSNVDHIYTISRNIVASVMASSLNHLRMTIPKGPSEDVDPSLIGIENEIASDSIPVYEWHDLSESMSDICLSKSITEQIVHQEDISTTLVCTIENNEYGHLRLEFDAENSFSEMQFRQASSPRSCHDKESFPAIVPGAYEISTSLQAEETNSRPLLIGDLHCKDSPRTICESRNSDHSDGYLQEGLLIAEPKSINVEKETFTTNTNAKAEENHNVGSLSPRYHHYNEGDSGYFDPCDSIPSREESEINFDHRAASLQMPENRDEYIRRENRQKIETTNANPRIAEEKELRDIQGEEGTDNIEDDSFNTFDASTQPVNAPQNDFTDVNFLSSSDRNPGIDDAIEVAADDSSKELDSQQQDISSRVAESFYFREKVVCTQEDMLSQDNQAEFRNASAGCSLHSDLDFQLSGLSQDTKREKPKADSGQNAIEITWEDDSTQNTGAGMLLCEKHNDTDKEMKLSVCSQETYIKVLQDGLNQNAHRSIQQLHLNEETSYIDVDCKDLHSNTASNTDEHRVGVTQDAMRGQAQTDISYLSNLDLQPSVFGQYLNQYAQHRHCDQNTKINEPFTDLRDEPFSDIHVVGVNHGVHTTLEQACYRIDDNTHLELYGLNHSPRMDSQTTNTRPGDDDGETGHIRFSTNERLALAQLSTEFLSPRLPSPRMTARMTPRSRSNFERLRAMHRQLHGLSAEGLQLGDTSAARPSREGHGSESDDGVSSTEVDRGATAEQAEGGGSREQTQESSCSWLLGIYKGVCHTIAKPDMPYMG
ncbi:hypothetical protein ElyMa_003187800 [Elysia marginata]|uniref:TIR domain-containing protein n=1 Tax=Elysia marginata TaxID=1093978 RepID=A0AAV4J463_9GAST|nr:hypothetical protein ElyMa_003187800 [Elysia marginata]